MRLLLLLGGLVGLSAIPFMVFGERFEAGDFLAFIQSDSPWAAVLGVAAMAADLVIPFPAQAIMTNFGMSWGWFMGGLLGSAGTFTAGFLAYWLCRLLGQRAVNFIAGEEDAARLKSFFERHGFWSIAVSRWIPLVPEVISSLAGAARMAQWRFMAGNLLGSLSVGFAYSTLGSMDNVPGYVLFAISIAVPVLMLGLFTLVLARSY
jgi:uncharacterized membrane protein YdjX (TVP38/TMEM64 family)